MRRGCGGRFSGSGGCFTLSVLLAHLGYNSSVVRFIFTLRQRQAQQKGVMCRKSQQV